MMSVDIKWKSLYCFIADVKKIMDVTYYEERNEKVTEHDIKKIVDYINNGIERYKIKS